MSLSAKEQCLAQEMIDLKARVKAEMNRRCRNGSLTDYAGTAYDYTVAPEAGGQMFTEHVNKIVVPMNAITASGMEEQVVGNQAMAMDGIDAKLTVYEVEPMQKNGTSSCSGACSGLCVGGCYNNCSGCGSSCGGCGGCSAECKNDCNTTCSGNCGGSSCGGGCGPCTGCLGACGADACTGCTASCRVDCTGYCAGATFKESGA